MLLSDSVPILYRASGTHLTNAIIIVENEDCESTYDLYWMDIDEKPAEAKGENKSVSPKDRPHYPRPVRLTYAPGADVLPVFSSDGKRIMWTSTRDGRQPSQLWMADFVPPKDE